MAKAPLLQLSDIGLTFGGDPVFEGLSLVVQPGDRVALVGRNGSGKSTLMKVMAGLVLPDSGTRVAAPGVQVGYMEQDPTMEGYATLGDYASSGLDPDEAYKVDMVAEGLKFDPAGDVATASGGERRRAALAKLMAEAPELMLLDEPTNHLDIEAIAWLEQELKTTRAAFVLISHDRAFLRALTRATLWIDRGQVRRAEEGFENFEVWRDKLWEEEDQQRHKLNRKIKAEARWAVEGISARRKRNQGRVRALQELRAEKTAQIARQGTAAMAFDGGAVSGKKVIEAFGLTKSYNGKQIVKAFAHLAYLLGLNLHISRRAADPAGWLMQKETSVGQAVPVFSFGTDKNQCARAGDPTTSDCTNSRSNETDHIVNHIATFNMPAG